MVKDELFSWTNPDDENTTALDLEAVEATVIALLNVVMTVQDADPARENRESRDLLPQQPDEVLQKESIGDQNSQIANYPDLVPRTETLGFEAERKLSNLRENFVKSQVHQIEQQSATTASQLTDFEFTDYRVFSEQFEIIENQEAVQSGPISETLFLLAILFGTCILLYFFPPGP